MEQLDNSKIKSPKYHMLCLSNSITDLLKCKAISKILQRFTYTVMFS